MKAWAHLTAAWREEMNLADRVRVVLALCFPFGAFGHFAWLGVHGLLYHGPAPGRAVWFWYGLCVADFVIVWLTMTRPRLGLALGVITMAYSLWVNWTFFPTFEFHFNYILIGLTAFGVTLFCLAPWLWLRSHWAWR